MDPKVRRGLMRVAMPPARRRNRSACATIIVSHFQHVNGIPMVDSVQVAVQSSPYWPLRCTKNPAGFAARGSDLRAEPVNRRVSIRCTADFVAPINW
jgi:hypothetical protein